MAYLFNSRPRFSNRGTHAFALVMLSFGVIVTTTLSAQVWFGENKNIGHADLAFNRTTVSATLSHNADALAFDNRSRTLWALTGSRLNRYSTNGELLGEIDLAPIGLGGAKLIAVDQQEGKLWVGESTTNGNTRSLARVDTAGAVATRVSLPETPEAMSVDLEGVIWVLAKKRVHAYSRSGSILANLDVSSLFNGEPKLIAVDAANDLTWLAGAKRLIALRPTSPSTSIFNIELPEPVIDLAMDAEKGQLWVLTNKSLLALDASGQQLSRLELALIGISGPCLLVFEPGMRRPVVAHAGGLTHFPVAPAPALTLSLAKEPKLLASAPLDLRAILSLETPSNGSLIKRNMPTFVLMVEQFCSGNPCNLPLPALDRYRLSAQLNGNELGAAFLF